MNFEISPADPARTAGAWTVADPSRTKPQGSGKGAGLDRRRPIVMTRAGEAPVRVVAGGNHVTSFLSGEVTGHSVDAITVVAGPGGGPPPHRHDFGEWFLVQEGALQFTGLVGGRIEVLDTAHAGDSVWVPPGQWHGTVNGSDDPVRFLVVGVPGVMTSYFAQAGVLVPDESSPPATPPPGPSQLTSLAAENGIEFFGLANRQ